MAKTTSKSKQATYAAYKANTRWKTNRQARLEKLLLKNPNNKQLERALQMLGYRRKKPTTSPWTRSTTRQAQQYKKVTGYAHPDLFSTNDKLQSDAVQRANRVPRPQAAKAEKVSFSIGARAHDGAGHRVWA